MDEKIQKIKDIIEPERTYVYNALLGDTSKEEFVGCGEEAEHLVLENDQQCKGALKALDFILKNIEEVTKK